VVDLSALYPQAPKPPDPMQAIGQAVGIANALNTNALFQRQFEALSQQPAAALRGQQILNDTALFEQRQKQTQQAYQLFGTLADEDNPTPEMARNRAALAARQGIPGDIIEELRRPLTLARSPAEFSDALKTMKNMAVGATGTSTRVEGPPGPAGQPRSISIGQANKGGPGGIITGLPPGQDITMKGAAQRAADLQATATTSPQYHADLENLLTDSKIMGPGASGPTFEIEKKWSQVANRLGIPQFGTMTAEQLKAGEGFDKIAGTIAARQAALIGASTDAGRHMTEHMNPSSAMSAAGRDAMTKLLLGNQDFVDAARNEWLQSRRPANEHDQFMQEFITGDKKHAGADPRVFQFARFSKEEQQKFLHLLDPSEIDEFDRAYRDAIDRKWVKPLKKSQ
jgi:hypothetical protein